MDISLDPIYQGSVKNVFRANGLPAGGEPGPLAVFEFTDRYSVFDWGQMPDPIPCKGAALNMTAAYLFEELQNPESWKSFSGTKSALDLRKGMSALKAFKLSPDKLNEAPKASLSTRFNELGEVLQARGLHSHYQGLLVSGSNGSSGKLQLSSYAQASRASERLVVSEIQVTQPQLETVLGKPVLDYQAVRSAPAPRLIPLEVVFRFQCPKGSSLIKHLKKDPDYIGHLAVPPNIDLAAIQSGEPWGFPVVELFSKLESVDRRVSFTEAMAISGISAGQLQDLIFRSLWVASFLHDRVAKIDAVLADGKLEWGLDRQGELFLVDSIGPDELRILDGGVQLSKEFLRQQYHSTSWYRSLGSAQDQARLSGQHDWKKLVSVEPPKISDSALEAASQVYRHLCNQITGREWFSGVWSRQELIQKIKEEDQS